MALIDTERAVVSVCFRAQVPDALLAELGDRRVWMLYREMVRDRLRKELEVALPRTHEAAPAALERAFVSHLDRTPPRSRFFRDVVPEFVATARAPLDADGTLAPWVGDLAAYEAALWEVADLDASEPGTPAEFEFERAPWLSPALRVLSLRHAVHEAPNAAGAYATAPTYLCVHRASDHAKPRTWTLNLSTYQLLRTWQSDPTLSVSDGVRRLARERGLVIEQTFIDGLCGVLAEFMDADLVLGSR